MAERELQPGDPEELLSHSLEGELEASERALVDEYLKAHPEAQVDLVFYRGLMDRLAALPGETPPPDFAARVMEACPGAPGSWSHRIEQALGRFFGPALVTATALGALVAFSLLPLGASRPGQIASLAESPSAVALLETGSGGALLVHGAVPAGGRKALSPGQLVSVGPGDPAELKFPGGVVARVAGGTRFSVSPREILLQQGKVRVSVKPGIGDFAVRGPDASAHVIGTEFEVEANGDGTTVSVHEGKVEVRAPGAEPVKVGAGEVVSAARRTPGVIAAGRPAPAAAPVLPSGSPEGVPGLDAR